MMESLEYFPNYKIARVISKLAERRGDDAEKMYELEYNWDYGWLCMLAWLMEKYQYLAFFALLAKVDTVVQEEVLFNIKHESLFCYDKLFFWHHISLGDAASTSYQHWRGLADPVWAAPFLKN